MHIATHESQQLRRITSRSPSSVFSAASRSRPRRSTVRHGRPQVATPAAGTGPRGSPDSCGPLHGGDTQAMTVTMTIENFGAPPHRRRTAIRASGATLAERGSLRNSYSSICAFNQLHGASARGERAFSAQITTNQIYSNYVAKKTNKPDVHAGVNQPKMQGNSG